MLKVKIVTIFPELFPGTLSASLIGKALQEKKWQLDVVNLRDYASAPHYKIDDEPFGGGNGMVMRPDVMGNCLDAIIEDETTKIFYTSAKGRVWHISAAKAMAQEKSIIIIAGRFDGIDQRVIDEYNITEISIGDYILAGGEVAAMVILESCLRFYPGIIKNNFSVDEDSFSLKDQEGNSLLENPVYTRPQKWRNKEVPAILTSGHHAQIKEWRLTKSISLTSKIRPDLLK